MQFRVVYFIRCAALATSFVCGAGSALAQQASLPVDPSDDHTCIVGLLDAKADKESGTVRVVLGGPTLQGSTVEVAFVTPHTLYGATFPNIVVASHGTSAIDDLSPQYSASMPDVADLDGVYVSTVVDSDGTKHRCDITNGLPQDALPYTKHLPLDADVEKRTAAAAQPAPTQAVPIAQFKTYPCQDPFATVHVRNAFQPAYPLNALHNGVFGMVIVAVTVDPEGHVVDTSIYKSSGSKPLDDAGLDAAKRTSYKPALFECAPTTGTYRFRADFRPS